MTDLDVAGPVDALDSEHAGARTVRGGVMRTAAYGGTLALGLVSVPLMTSRLGVVRFGYYVTVSSIVLIMGMLTEAGLTNLGIREFTSRTGRDREHYLRSLAGLRFGLTTAGAGGAALVAWALGEPGEIVAGCAICGLGMLLGVVQQTYSIALTVGLRFGWLSLLDLLRQVVLVGGIVVCVLLRTPLAVYFLANVAAYGSLLIATLVLVRRDGRTSLRPRVDRAAWRRMARRAAPYALATAAGVVYFRLGVVLLGVVSSDYEVGIYSTAFRITEVICAAPPIIVSTAFPILVRAAQDDPARLRAGVQRLFEAALLVGVLVVVPMVVGARFAIGVIAPIDEFRASVPVLRLQVLAVAFTFVVAAFSFVLLSLERYRALMWCNLAALVAAVAGTAALAGPLGAKGAAIATTASEAVLAVGCLIAAARTRRELLPDLRAVPRALVCAAPGLAAAALPVAPVVRAGVAFIVVAAVALAVGAVPRELLAALRLRRAAPS